MTYRNVLSLCYRSVWFLILLYSYFEQSKVNKIVPVEFNRCLKFGGRYVFLTHLNQLFSKIAFFMLILSNFNIIPRSVSSVFWTSTSLPLSFIVVVMYWSLHSINPDLVRKKEVIEVMLQFLRFFGQISLSFGSISNSG